MQFDKNTDVEKLLELYGIKIPCEVEFVGDSNEVMFKFRNLKVVDKLIKEE